MSHVAECLGQLSRTRFLRFYGGPAAGWHLVFGDFLICSYKLMNILR